MAKTIPVTKSTSGPFEVEPYPELVFGIIGPLGVGIDHITQILSEELRRVGYNASVIRLSELLPDQAIMAFLTNVQGTIDALEATCASEAAKDVG